jgi:hypothetical protein
MKTIKTIIIATVIAVAIMISCACAMPACAEGTDTHEVTGVVIAMNVAHADTWEITVLDEQGDEWAFYADNNDGEYWHIGDLVLMTMWKDEVVDVILLGELTPVGVARWMGW